MLNSSAPLRRRARSRPAVIEHLEGRQLFATVSIAATDPVASAASDHPGAFTVTRSDTGTTDLLVRISFGPLVSVVAKTQPGSPNAAFTGTASLDDFVATPLYHEELLYIGAATPPSRQYTFQESVEVTIPAGSRSVNIPIYATGNDDADRDLTVIAAVGHEYQFNASVDTTYDIDPTTATVTVDESKQTAIPGSIAGTVTGGPPGETVFLDANNNGVLDAGELSTTTTAAGAFKFPSVTPGNYTIDQNLPSGYRQTSPVANAGIAVNVASSATLTGENFTDAASVLLTGTTIGTAGSYKNDGNTIAKATDGNLATFFDGPTPSGNWVGLDLGPTGGVVTELKFAGRPGYPSRMVGGIFQASNSSSFSSGDVNLLTVASVPPTGLLQIVNVTNTAAYRYYRYLSPANSYGDVAEAQFFGTAGGLKTTTSLTGTTIGTTGSYRNDGNTIARATDGNLATFFDGPTTNGNWVGLDFGSAVTVSQIAYAPRAGFSSRMVGGLIQTSTTADFSAGVTTIYTITTAPSAGASTLIEFSSPVVARYIRYLSPVGSYGDISEFQALG